MKIGKFSPNRPLSSYAKFQGIMGAVVRGRHFHLDKSRLKDKHFLDVGCGPNRHDDFINLDYAWHRDLDICWDITKGIPLPSSSLQGIFTEHCLEHIPLASADFLIGDFHRILQPGGNLRIVVPDGRLYLNTYHEIENGSSQSSLPYSEEDVYQGLYTPMMSVNRIFRAHGHQFIFDFETLRLLLEKNGFSDIKKAAFNSGRNQKLLIDTEARAAESLYVEASKD